MDQPLPSPSDPSPLPPASYECRRRFGGSIRIDVDAAGIARTDKRGWRHLRWADVRILTRSRGNVITLGDASRTHLLAVPRDTENLQALLNTIEERLASAHTTRVRPGSSKPQREVTHRQHRKVVATVLAGGVVVAAICAWLAPFFYIDAMLSVIGSLAYLAILPKGVVVGPDFVEMAAAFTRTRVPAHAIRDVRLLILPDRGQTIVVTLSGGADVELRGYGDGAIFLYDSLRQIMTFGSGLALTSVRRNFTPLPALGFATMSVAIVAILLGLPVWNGRALSAGVRWLPPQLVNTLLSIGAPLEGRDWDGRTAVYNAAKFGRIEALNLLLSRGGDPALRSANTPGHTPLHVAAEFNQVEAVRALLAAGGNPNVRNNWDQTPLVQLMLLGKRLPGEPEVLRLLLDAGADVGLQDNRGFSALHAAADKPELADVVRTLSARAKDLNLRTAKDHTPFDLAVISQAWPVARALVTAGARVDTDRSDRDTWLYVAVHKKDAAMITHLLEYGARVDTVGNGGYLPLQVAAFNGDVHAIGLLVDAGADLDGSTGTNPPPLQIALRQGHLDAARALVAKGSSPNLPYKGWNALQRAAHSGDVKAAQLLLETGADPNYSTSEAPPALLVAAAEGRREVVQVLLDAGVDINTQYRSWTPLRIASARRHDAVRALLTERGAL